MTLLGDRFSQSERQQNHTKINGCSGFLCDLVLLVTRYCFRIEPARKVINRALILFEKSLTVNNFTGLGWY